MVVAATIAPVRQLTEKERMIRDALAELRGARIIADRCPSTENLNTVVICEEALDALLDTIERNHHG